MSHTRGSAYATAGSPIARVVGSPHHGSILRMTGSFVSLVVKPMSLPGLDGLVEYGKRGPTRVATVGTDAGQGPGQSAARSRGLVLRAEVGRLPGDRVP